MKNSIKLTSNKSVHNYCKPYIIAELGSNHNGDMELAKKMIHEAKKAGAHCVKFQSWSKETIFSRKKYEDNFFLKDDYRERKDFSLEQIVEAFSISEEQLLQMKSYADNLGIDCTSTPFSENEVDFLVDQFKTPFIKVASMDLNNYPFLEYIAKKQLPIVLSTGLSTLAEIDNAINVIEKAGNNQVILLHCVSLYPPDDKQVNLNNIETLQKLYPYPIGFSDHTLGTTIPIASVAKGACIIEKHFTLDKDMFGWDHKVSANPDELKTIVEESNRLYNALGSHRIQAVEDVERRSEFRRSIVTKRELTAGEVIKPEDIDFKRPGTGIKPSEAKYVIGRTVKELLRQDDIINWNDLV